MKNFLEYKDYIGSIEYNPKKETFFGKILGIKGLFAYSAENAKALKTAFMQAVEDYIDTCSIMKQKPEKSCKGSFNIRLTPDLHKQVFTLSNKKNTSLNSFVKEAIKEKVQKEMASE